MNIRRIRDVINKEKEKYFNENNNIESFSENFQLEEFNPKTCFIMQVITLFSFIILTSFGYGFAFSSSIYENMSNYIFLQILQILSVFLFVLSIPIGVGISLGSVWKKATIFYSKKIFNRAKDENERKTLSRKNFNKLFFDVDVSPFVLNEMKIQLTKDEYVDFKTRFPKKITYKELGDFLNDKQRIQNIHKEQEVIVMNEEQIESYKNNINVNV